FTFQNSRSAAIHSAAGIPQYGRTANRRASGPHACVNAAPSSGSLTGRSINRPPSGDSYTEASTAASRAVAIATKKRAPAIVHAGPLLASELSRATTSSGGAVTACLAV